MIAIAVLSTLFSVNVRAAVDEEQMAVFEADGHKQARKDRTAEGRVEDRVARCVQELVAAQSENAASEPASPAKAAPARSESVAGDPSGIGLGIPF